jgi:hypothetical protein
MFLECMHDNGSISIIHYSYILGKFIFDLLGYMFVDSTGHPVSAAN